MPQIAGNKKIILFGLIGLGFAGLIGAHELAAGMSTDGPGTYMPLILAGAGTACFIAAGLMARKLMRQGTFK
jgi:tellurite resistance protein TehA-like permease